MVAFLFPWSRKFWEDRAAVHRAIVRVAQCRYEQTLNNGSTYCDCNFVSETVKAQLKVEVAGSVLFHL
jgi:hypothetical protein